MGFMAKKVGYLTGAVAVMTLLVGCVSTTNRQSEIYSTGLFNKKPHMKSVVAVMALENKSGFSGKWNLGEGVADLINAELLDSSKVIVLERQNLNDVVGELAWQGNNLFRPEGRVEKGRLKNAEFLIRGVITDFTVTGDSSGWFSTDAASLKAGSSKARVAIAVKLYEVGSGEVISVVKADAKSSAGMFGARINYKSVAFGGDSYFRTPLGKATEKAIARAVKQILEDLPVRDWQPRVAEVAADMIYINGGQNVRLKPGSTFLVRESARPITDPSTGNVIDLIPGKAIGRLEVMAVGESTSQARITAGHATRGDYLEAVELP